jgi:uncharacterized membrane protein
MKNKPTLYIVQGALIAAMYIVMTVLQYVLLPGTVSNEIQFRVSEVLTILALYTPAAIPGLTIGCVLANIFVGLGSYDLLFGPLATLIAALVMYAVRNVRLFKLPVLAALMPALFNGLLVGFEIDFFFNNNAQAFNFVDFLIMGGFVAIGEIAVLFVLGLPLSRVLELNGLDKRIFALKSNKQKI